MHLGHVRYDREFISFQAVKSVLWTVLSRIFADSLKGLPNMEDVPKIDLRMHRKFL